MKREVPVRIQRIDRLSSVVGKGHDVLVGNRRIARVVGLGENDFKYYLYDESQNDRVVQHIRRLAEQRRRPHPDPLCWDDPFGSGPLVA